MNEELNRLAGLVVCAARAAWVMSLSHSTETQRRYAVWARGMPPEVGATVFETSSGARAEKTGQWLDYVGTYRGTEWVTIPASDDGESEEHRREYHVIETFDGRRVRWDNCEFVRVPGSWSTPP